MSIASFNLQSLRQSIAKIGRDGGRSLTASFGKKTPTGHAALDQTLGGGLAPNAVHEIIPSRPTDLAAATAFALGLVTRFTGARDWVWIGEEMTRREGGHVYGPGLKNFGLDPARLLLVAPHAIDDALKAAEDALRCAALGAVLFELWGNPKQLDLVAWRRLALAAEDTPVPLICLRHSAHEGSGSVRTRWSVAAAPSHGHIDMGGPRFALSLVLNRQIGAGGAHGSWITEWSYGERLFRPADSVDHLSLSADRPAETSKTIACDVSSA